MTSLEGLGSRSRALFLLCLAGLAGCTPRRGPAPSPAPLFSSCQRIPAERPRAPSESYLPIEILGSGVALLDADGDGDLDIYLRTPGDAAGPSIGGASSPPAPPATDRVWRNRWREDGALRFEEITAAAGIGSYGWAFGVAAGDADNDGDTDLFLTNLGPDVLLENRGDGTFRPRPGPWDGPIWSAPASFFDADGDGDLDLFVGRYLDFDPARHRPCRGPDTRPDYCGPLSYSPLPDAFFRNLGGGDFRRDATPGGIGSLKGNALGSIAEDFDGDGRLDLYVANDAGDNHLWLNRGAAGFEEQAGRRGLAVNAAGQREAGMGVAVADFDRDGDPDVVVSHLTGESNTLYVNLGDGYFDDQTRSHRLEVPSLPLTGFGIGWLYADDDAWLDLLVFNGRIHAIAAQRATGAVWPYAEPALLMLSAHDGTDFVAAAETAGEVISRRRVARSAAFGDLDDDGDLDVVVSDNDGSAEILENMGDGRWPWLGVLPRTGHPPRDALGAQVTVRLDDGATLTARSRSDGSYLAANDPRVLLRLPRGTKVSSLEIRWPSGCTDVVQPAPAPGRYHVVQQECR